MIQKKYLPAQLVLLAEVVDTDQETSLTTSTVGKLKVGRGGDVGALGHTPALGRWRHVGRHHLLPKINKNGQGNVLDWSIEVYTAPYHMTLPV